MSKIAIDVVGLGKKYHIGGLQKSYYRLTDQVADISWLPFAGQVNYCAVRPPARPN